MRRGSSGCILLPCRQHIGKYVAAMDGVDTIAFTAGIGENDGHVRAEVMENFHYLGIEIDAEKNSIRGENVKISTDDSKVDVVVIPTNEELAICRDSLASACIIV